MPVYNPFSRHNEVTAANLFTYRLLTILTWLLSVITSFYYTYHSPHHKYFPDAAVDPLKFHHHYHTIFGQSHAHPTPFTVSHVFVAIYFVTLFLLQAGYVWHLFSSNEAWVRAACLVGPHFILFNLLHFAHIMLWTRAEFVWSELMVALNFLQLTSAYFRYALPHPTSTHPTTRSQLLRPAAAETQLPPPTLSLSTIKTIHIPTISMPLVWTYFALFWNGAVMTHCQTALVCRVLANVAIWGLVPFAGTFLFGYGDWTVGLETAVLAAGLGVGQFFLKVWALQWIFAFTIMGLVFLATLAWLPYGSARVEGERAPLLAEA